MGVSSSESSDSQPSFLARMARASSTTGARRAAVGVLVVGGLHAAVSFYWLAGGQWGIDGVGIDLPERIAEGDPEALAIVWVSAFLKVVGAVVGLVAVWWKNPRWIRTTARWVCLVAGPFLILYGFGIALAALSVLIGLVEAAPDANMTALRWHAFLWNPWFGIWGVLLVLSSRTGRHRTQGG